MSTHQKQDFVQIASSNLEAGRGIGTITAVPKSSTQSNNMACVCCSQFCMTFAVMLGMGLFLALPIAEIVMAEKHRSDMKCPNDIVSPYTWMLTEGIVGIFIYGIIGVITVCTMQGKNSTASGVAGLFFVPLVLLTLFHTAWIIVGAVMFWRDCIDLEDSSMNEFYWAVLIINLVSIYFSGKTKNSDEK